MFQGLSEKLENAFKKFRNKGKLTEADIKAGMREIKLALLEADVNFKVVKDFINSVSDRAVGAEVVFSFCPINELSLAEGTNERTIADFERALDDALEFPLISYLEDYILLEEAAAEFKEFLESKSKNSYYVNISKQTMEKADGGYAIKDLSELKLIYFIATALEGAAKAYASY